MKLAYIKLDDKQISDMLNELPGWAVQSGKLSRTFTFNSYKGGIDFAVKVGALADKLNHHPDMSIGYGKVTVSVNTHDVGGISPYDFELARQVDGID